MKCAMRRRDPFTLAALLCALVSSRASAQAFRPGFEAAGTSGNVYSLCVFDDGTGSRLFAAGDFDAAGSALASHIARWNFATQSWSTLGAGVDGRVGAMVVFDEDGAGPQPPRLFVAGEFKHAGGLPARNIARWNGSAWSTLASGLDDVVTSLAVFDDDGPGPRPAALYAGGLFTSAGATPAASVARWNGASWEPLGLGLDAPVASLTVFDDDGPLGPHREELLAGGFFSNAGSVPTNQIARWNGLSWQPLSNGVQSTSTSSSASVTALGVFDADGAGPQPGRLFIGGSFNAAGASAANGVAQWDGVQFSPLASGISASGSFPTIRAFTSFNDGSGPKLYATGLFRSAGGVVSIGDAFNTNPILSVARWDGSQWAALGVGNANNLNGIGRALVAFDDDGNGTPSLFVGGHFSTAGGSASSGVARWSGSNWQPLGLGAGVGGDVCAFASASLAPNAPLVVGGAFHSAGALPANHVAVWNEASSSWSSLGVGVDATVRALEFHNSSLYAGGDFTTSGGTPVAHVAAWNGSVWSPVGGGMDATVRALKSQQGRLYAGGDFKQAGATSASFIAAFDGASWTPLGAGVDDVVYALESFDETGGSNPSLYVGGDFQHAGGLAATGVARWNGVSWSPVGGGLCCGGVYALAVFNDGSGARLYAAGSFDLTGDGRIDGVARYNAGTQTWQALGTGFSGGGTTLVRSLAPGNFAGVPTLFVGGDFDSAGGAAARNVARFTNSTWFGFGSGTDRGVNALRSMPVTIGGEALFVGGSFTVADGRPSAHFARTN